MPDFRSVLITFFLCLLFPGCRHSKTVEKVTRPSIVFFYIDDLGWKDVGFNGSTFYETPNIDKIAAEGIIFTNAYANAPNCAPSRASLMTGMYTPRHKIYTVGSSARGREEDRKMIPVENTVTLPLEYETVAEALQGVGYRTGHFGKWHLGNIGFYPEDQGFDVNVGGHESGSPPGGHFAPYKNPKLTDGSEGEYLTDRLTDEALDFIGERGNQPFFLYLAHYAVHVPLQAKPDIEAKYGDKMPDGGQNNATYAAMIESVDQSVGRILSRLDELGKTDDTLVIFYSDNGGAIQATSNEPLRGYKGMLYEGGIRVPLAMRWPRVIAASRTDDTPVIGVDFYPTLGEIAGFEPPADADGVSLVPIIQETGALVERSLYWHFPAYLEKAGPMTTPWRTTPAGAVRSGDFKLIEFFEDGTIELYDLAHDRSETTNLAEKIPGKMRELHEMLKSWREEIGADMPVMK